MARDTNLLKQLDKEATTLASAILLQAIKDLSNRSLEIKDDARRFLKSKRARIMIEGVGIDYNVFRDKIRKDMRG